MYTHAEGVEMSAGCLAGVAQVALLVYVEPMQPLGQPFHCTCREEGELGGMIRGTAKRRHCDLPVQKGPRVEGIMYTSRAGEGGGQCSMGLGQGLCASTTVIKIMS